MSVKQNYKTITFHAVITIKLGQKEKKLNFSVLLGHNPRIPVRNTSQCFIYFVCSYRKSVCRKMEKKTGREKRNETKEEIKINK
jgi:hypothetical protein